MEKINLVKIDHTAKRGDICEYKEPNIVNDSLFFIDDKLVGFYLTDLPKRCVSLLDLINCEFRSDRVAKSDMARRETDGVDLETGKYKYKSVLQFSTIIGSIPPKPHMKRCYASRSSIHLNDKAQPFIKGMYLLACEGEKLLQEFMPEQYELQKNILSRTDSKWKFGELFTSSISNFNISAPFHQDNGNVKDSVNLIFTRRKNSIGGSLNVPDYDITIKQANNSLLVYPAWANLHGVTPILPIQQGKDFYRNSFVFYPLACFEKLS